MRHANDRCFGDRGVCDEGALHLRRSQAVSRRVQHIVDAAGHPVEAIGVLAGTISGEVKSRVGPHVHVQKPFMVAPDRARDAGPRTADGEDAFDLLLGVRQLLPRLRVQDREVDAKEGERARPGLHRGRARQGRPDVATRLRLPVRVHDRAPLLPDHLVVPAPGLGVDRLPDASKNPEGRPVVLLHGVFAEAHQGADGRRSRVQLRDAMPLHDVPVAAGVRVKRRGLEHDSGRSVHEGTVHDVAVTCDPAEVRQASVHISVAEIEHLLAGECRVRQVSCRGVRDALRPARRAAGVQNEERVL
mmetsp:Transcript_10748/g.40372  ORF Transcript_10748/g.40372 Transcript_10748/m.40372 type:complete len:302 (-) Transcript_10748:990-1895(-)